MSTSAWGAQVYGSSSQQLANSSNDNTIHMNKVGGGVLTDVAVPAVLLYASNVIKSKSNSRNSTKYHQRKSRRNRRFSRK